MALVDVFKFGSRLAELQFGVVAYQIATNFSVDHDGLAYHDDETDDLSNRLCDLLSLQAAGLSKLRVCRPIMYAVLILMTSAAPRLARRFDAQILMTMISKFIQLVARTTRQMVRYRTVWVKIESGTSIVRGKLCDGPDLL